MTDEIHSENTVEKIEPPAEVVTKAYPHEVFQSGEASQASANYQSQVAANNAKPLPPIESHAEKIEPPAAISAPAKPLPPIEFHALDRFHAITYVTTHYFHNLADAAKAKLLQALQAMTHQGPVVVSVPAPPVAPGTPEPPAGTPKDADPAKPDDGAFAVQPFDFVKV